MKILFNDLGDFYKSGRGRMIRQLMRVLLKDWWPNVGGLHVLGIGYTQPFAGFLKQDEPLSLTLLMNRHYAAHCWPDNRQNSLALCDDVHLPIETQRMNRILLMHGLETSEEPRGLLEELWRILDGNGRMVVVVPNRAGVWARTENTPFGQGHPYSLSQLRHLLTDAGFSIERYQRALYVPSGRSRILISLAPLFERIGRRLCPAFGGILMIEVSKQLFSAHSIGSKEKSLSPAPILPKAVETN